MSNPWTIATPGETQDIEPLCKHVCDTLNVADDVEVVGCTGHYPTGLTSQGEIKHLKIWLKHKTTFSYVVEIQPPETGERVLKAKTVLAQLIMKDPLLLNGVTEFDYGLNTNIWSGHLIFHGHTVDISAFFDGTILQTGAIVNEIIHKVSTSSGHQYVCSIGMVPIRGSVAYLECENTPTQQRFYEEVNILKWVSEHGSSPFTRLSCVVSDIKIHDNVRGAGGLSSAPRLAKTRDSVDISTSPKKKARLTIGKKKIQKNITCVWDCSGSMGGMYDESRTGLRKTIEEQRALAISTGNPTSLTVVTFDNEITCRVNSEDINTVDISELDDWVRPRGTTRLYDAVISAASRISKSPCDSGLLIVMTDGHDTDSEVSPSVVREVLEKLKDDKDIECIFMAANIGNAQIVGPSLGFSSDTSITFTPGAAGAAFESMSQSALRSVTGGSARFTTLERQSSAGSVDTGASVGTGHRHFRFASVL